MKEKGVALFRTRIFFNVKRVTKKNWEDATCDNCGKEFYPEEKEAYVWEGRLKGYLQLCRRCIQTEF